MDAAEAQAILHFESVAGGGFSSRRLSKAGSVSRGYLGVYTVSREYGPVHLVRCKIRSCSTTTTSQPRITAAVTPPEAVAKLTHLSSQLTHILPIFPDSRLSSSLSSCTASFQVLLGCYFAQHGVDYRQPHLWL